MWPLLKVIPVHKDILASRVAMEIANKSDVSFPIEFSNHPFDMPINWVERF